MDIIRSKENKLVKHGRKLTVRKYRQESGEYMIEGLRAVEEGISARAPIKYCLCSDDLCGGRVDSLLKAMSGMGIDVYRVEGRLLKDICETETPQGILAVVEKREIKLENIIKNTDLLVLVDRIQDPGNLGTIIRTAHASGCGGVLVSGGTVDPYSSKVLRSTMGSIFKVPVISSPNMCDAIGLLKENGFTIFVSCLNGSAPYYTENYKVKTAIVIGNEANGVDSSIIQKGDVLIKIPMPGNAESLNAGVACGILLFEAVRQRSSIDK